MAVLLSEQIVRLHAAIVSARLTDNRTALLGRIDPAVVDSLPTAPTPSGQILSDLNTLNAAVLLDGSTPIRTWLENAVALAGGRAEAQVFAELLGREARGGHGGALFLVPFLQNPSFVGRGDDLEALHALLQKGEAVGVRPAALTGMGGIGKTQLAVEYAYRYRDAYFGGVCWVNAAEDWQTEFARLAVDVGLGAGDAPEAERRRRLTLAFAEWLRARPGALVIFDNVEDPLALRSPGPGFIAEQLGCRLLFTTRRRDPDLPFASIDVRVLPEDAALALLLSSEARRGLPEGGAEAEIGAAKAICRTLGYLPLAIVLAAAHLGKYPRNTVESYLGWLHKQGALAAMDAARVDSRLLATRHEAAVGATLRLSWDALRSDEAKRVLQTAALLGEAAQVPRARLSLLTGLSADADAWCAAPLSEALGELAGLSLVEELTEQEIRLHPLVRTLAGHTEWVTGVAVTADGHYDCTLKVWDLSPAKSL